MAHEEFLGNLVSLASQRCSCPGLTVSDGRISMNGTDYCTIHNDMLKMMASGDMVDIGAIRRIDVKDDTILLQTSNQTYKASPCRDDVIATQETITKAISLIKERYSDCDAFWSIFPSEGFTPSELKGLENRGILHQDRIAVDFNELDEALYQPISTDWLTYESYKMNTRD